MDSVGTDPIDAVVLAGGRSSRLSGTDKSSLMVNGRTLLDRTVSAARAARRIAVVGDPAALGPRPRDGRVLVTREEPAFGGPAAGIAAGLTVLADAAGDAPSAFTLVLACDMPAADGAVRSLLHALEPDSDGVIAVDDRGHRQPLAAVYSTSRLSAAVREHGGLQGSSVRSLISAMRLVDVPVPPGATDDIDTWTDAARLGVRGRPAHPVPVSSGAPPAASSRPTRRT